MLIKNLRYRLNHLDDGQDTTREEMLLANACLHKENISGVDPYWKLKQQNSQEPLLDLCLFVACVR
jgi:hypothetical protein